MHLWTAFASKLGHEVDFWRDQSSLRFGQNWREEIEAGIRDSAVFIAIISPTYRVSEWCARERSFFRSLFHDEEAMKVTLKSGSAYRFLKIVKLPWEDDSHLEFFRDAQHFFRDAQHLEFYQRDSRSYDSEFPPGSELFNLRISEAAHYVAALLRSMRRRNEAVFTASPADDVREEWNDVRNELSAQGYDVRPEGPMDSFFADKLLRAEISPAILTVHILGARFDEFAEKQVRVASTLGKRLLIWLVRDPQAGSDLRQQQFIMSLRNGEIIQSDFDLLTGPPRRVIADVLSELRPAPSVPVTAKISNVYLLCDVHTGSDLEFAQQIRDWLKQEEGLSVRMPERAITSGTEMEDEHVTSLRSCEAALLYHSNAPLPWLVQQAPRILLAEQLINRPPLRSKAFLLSDPALLRGFPNVIRKAAKLEACNLEPFLAPLRDKRPTGMADYAISLGLDQPFPGLRSFEPEESFLFFGRQRHVADLLQRLSRNRLLAVVGGSGTGKSSLVRAGLLASLYRGYLLPSGSRWRIAVMRPGELPLASLAAALSHVVGKTPLR